MLVEKTALVKICKREKEDVAVCTAAELTEPWISDPVKPENVRRQSRLGVGGEAQREELQSLCFHIFPSNLSFHLVL